MSTSNKEPKYVNVIQEDEHEDEVIHKLETLGVSSKTKEVIVDAINANFKKTDATEDTILLFSLICILCVCIGGAREVGIVGIVQKTIWFGLSFIFGIVRPFAFEGYRKTLVSSHSVVGPIISMSKISSMVKKNMTAIELYNLLNKVDPGSTNPSATAITVMGQLSGLPESGDALLNDICNIFGKFNLFMAIISRLLGYIEYITNNPRDAMRLLPDFLRRLLKIIYRTNASTVPVNIKDIKEEIRREVIPFLPPKPNENFFKFDGTPFSIDINGARLTIKNIDSDVRGRGRRKRQNKTRRRYKRK